MPKFLVNGSTFRVFKEEDMVIVPKLPPAVFTVGYSDLLGYYLSKVADNFTVSEKLYGDISKTKDRILNTFRNRPAGTGVLLAGEKGCGKTLLAKLVANESGVPTVMVNQPYSGENFNDFINTIDDCIVMFDEFEKVYEETEDQNKLLTVLDGVFQSRKLFVLTVNESSKVNRHMINRPGRIFYNIDYSSVSKEFVTEYCEENLENKAHIEGVLQLATIVDKFNFDMLKGVVEEMNRYKESAQDASKLMNIKADSYRMTLSITNVKVNGEEPYSWNKQLYTDPLDSFSFSIFLTDKKDEYGDYTDNQTIVATRSGLKSIGDGKYNYEINQRIDGMGTVIITFSLEKPVIKSRSIFDLVA